MMVVGTMAEGAATLRHTLCHCLARCARNAGKRNDRREGLGGSRRVGGPGGGNLRPGVGGLAFRRYWETSSATRNG